MSEANRSLYHLFSVPKSLAVQDQDEDLRGSVRSGGGQIALGQGRHIFIETYAHLGPEWS